mmetsp:Transcript_48033/g.133757  ORF Transcript_48033/g.133757 Transcript_48033/m.133757 type:complete len:163 (+) Transcript_48033:165-653(+)
MADKRTKRVAKELSKVDGKCEEFTITADEGDMFKWHVVMHGPAKYKVGEEERDCPYAGRDFELECNFPEGYPFKPPEVKFTGRGIYHPNVAQDGAQAGELCERFVKDFWAPTRMAEQFLQHVYNLLANPDPDDAVAEDVAGQMRDRLAEFEAQAAKSGVARK